MVACPAPRALRQLIILGRWVAVIWYTSGPSEPEPAEHPNDDQIRRNGVKITFHLSGIPVSSQARASSSGMVQAFAERLWFCRRAETIGHMRAGRLAWIATLAVLCVPIGCGNSHGRTCRGEPGADLSGRAVGGWELSQGRLRCANLERSTLDGEVVREANLSAANLHHARLHRAWLENVDLSGADLTEAVVESARLSGVDLTRADLRGSTLADSQLTDVSLAGARLQGAVLRTVVASRSDLSGADVRDADLTGASLVDTNLRGARLDGAKLAGTTWSNVVCPDGVKSGGEDRESCDGHLTPVR
jgi:uncharacterized protein YjbI with pentapeptide repeats